jgi:hypothetical protein
MNPPNEKIGGRAWRVTVRLDAHRADLLRRLSESSGCDPSRVLREALDRFAGPPGPGIIPSKARLPVGAIASDTALNNVTVAPAPQPTAAASQQDPFPQNPIPRSRPGHMAELLQQYRAYGSELWNERRRVFKRLFCTALLAQENGENPKDRELHNELLRIGRTYGLFH